MEYREISARAAIIATPLEVIFNFTINCDDVLASDINVSTDQIYS